MVNLQQIQEILSREKVDGWLIYDFRGTNRPALDVLSIAEDAHLTRRFFYWVPVRGEPTKVVSTIESARFDHLPGRQLAYSSWEQLEHHLQNLLQATKYIAMEYSPKGALPYISTVDGGTIDLVRSFGVDVVSSAPLLAAATPKLDQAAQQSHLEAAAVAEETFARAWGFIADHLRSGAALNEYDVQEFLLCELSARRCVTDHPPICAINENSADPHYAPTQESAKPIQPGDWILIDMWCRQEKPGAIYADFTQVVVAAPAPTAKQKQIFSLVKEARDAALTLIKQRLQTKQPITGWEVDQVARQIITDGGYGEAFIHRTGHNISTELHGRGTHLDNYETHDIRPILPGTCFSIEPGIYLPRQFGVRLECNVLISETGDITITGQPQATVRCLLVD